MNKLFNIAILSSILLMAACGETDSKAILEKKKKELSALKDEQADLDKKVNLLDAEIAKLDPSAAKPDKPKLVSLEPVSLSFFAHTIDLQGKVDADNISYVSPRNGGGIARQVLVKRGDQVKKGQLIIKMDDAIPHQQLENAQIQLDHAKDLYQRRKNLWDQKIGTEVDLINAKNSVDQAEVQVRISKEQLDFTNVYADINGVVDDITIKPGELFSGQGQIRIVNTSSLKAVIPVPEVYQERIKVGSAVKIILPELNGKTINGTVSVAGKLIDAQNRSFTIEVRVPYDPLLRPNQLAIAKIQDYTNANAVAIPVNTLQTDDKGKFVMVSVTENGKTIARKRIVIIGQAYGDRVEIKDGLKPGDQLITDGFQNLYEGQLITTKA
jgi:RND family efflux transporter MFP subunit